MNIVFLVDSVAYGGAGRVVAQLANGFCHSNNKVIVATMSSSDQVYYLEENVIFAPLYSGKKRSFQDKISSIRALCKKYDAKILITFMAELNVYGILSSIGEKWKVIISERNDPVITPKEKRVRLLRKLTYPFANGYVFQTNTVKSYFSRYIQKRSCIIFNPLLQTLPKPYEGIRNKEIVAVGRLNSQKNYLMLIEAFNIVHLKHPDYKLKIYGEGPQRSELEMFIQKESLEQSVFLMGQVKDVHEKIRNASMFIMSSDYEGLSNALIEALALGLPVITTDHGGGGARELINDGVNGLLIPVGASEILAQKIEYLILHPDYASKLGKNGAMINDIVNERTICDSWFKYIDTVIGRGKS